jgi:L-idonate 5-dehydrogenase
MGANDVINLVKEPEGLDIYSANKGTFDVMFEASGSDKALRAGLAVVMPRGVIVSIGLGGDAQIPLNMLVAKEIELRGTFRFHSEFAVAVAFLNQGLIDGKPVISDIIAFDQSEDAFKLACDKSKSMKVQIAFDKELAF